MIHLIQGPHYSSRDAVLSAAIAARHASCDLSNLSATPGCSPRRFRRSPGSASTSDKNTKSSPVARFCREMCWSIRPFRNKVRPSQYRMPLPPAGGPPITGPVAAPPKSDKVAYGAYLAGPMGHCIDCHTPMVEGGRRDFANRTGAGGFLLAGPYGEVVSANITPHPETGIGTWTDAQIKRAITEGVRADGRALSPPMGYAFYKTMRGEDLDALVAYLRSLKPVDNKVR